VLSDRLTIFGATETAMVRTVLIPIGSATTGVLIQIGMMVFLSWGRGGVAAHVRRLAPGRGLHGSRRCHGDRASGPVEGPPVEGTW
jgi:hypothetical protein